MSAVGSDRSGAAGRLVMLDAVRGLAACFVAVYHAHFFFPRQVLPSGYLGVDLFFVLSGFVIAQAYERRFARGLTPRSFVITRLIRLYPIYMVGFTLGLLGAVVRLFVGWSELSALALLGAAVTGLFFLPSFGTMKIEERIVPVNGPAWSLLFELVANLLHVLVWRWLTIPVLIGIVGGSAAWLMAAAAYYENLDLGWRWAGLDGGLPRVLFSYFIGVLIFRIKRRGVLREVSPWWLLAALALIFAWKSGPVTDMLTVLVAFPVIVWLALNYQPKEQMRRPLEWLGAVSYPLYAIHYPIYHLATGAFKLLGLSPAAEAVGGVLVISATIGISGLLAHFYDEPVRAFLSRLRSRLRRRRSLAVQAM